MRFKLLISFLSIISTVNVEPKTYTGDTPELSNGSFVVNSTKFTGDTTLDNETVTIEIKSDGLNTNVFALCTVIDLETNLEIFRDRHELNSLVTQTEKYNIDLPTQLNSSHGNLVSFIVKNNSTIFVDSSLTYYLKTETTYDDPFKNNKIIKNTYGFYIENNEIKPINDILDFSESPDYFMCDQYYRLDFKEMSFKHYGKDIASGNGYLIIENPTPCFNSLNEECGTRIYLPISYKETNNSINLFFSNTMYVEKRTLKMSLQPRDGYLATNYFYLPLNKKKEVAKNDFIIQLEDIGVNNQCIEYHVTYDTSRNLIGDCNDSDYCIKHGVSA